MQTELLKRVARFLIETDPNIRKDISVERLVEDSQVREHVTCPCFGTRVTLKNGENIYCIGARTVYIDNVKTTAILGIDDFASREEKIRKKQEAYFKKIA